MVQGKTCWFMHWHRCLNWRRMQRQSGEGEYCNSEERWQYHGCLAMRPLHSVHWTRISCVCPLPVHLRSFIIKTSQRSFTKYLIASRKLLATTVQVNTEITWQCSKVKRIIVVQKGIDWMSSMLFCVAFKLKESMPLATRTHAKEQVNSNVRVTTLMCCQWKLLQINFYKHNLMMSCFFCPLLS